MFLCGSRWFFLKISTKRPILGCLIDVLHLCGSQLAHDFYFSWASKKLYLWGLACCWLTISPFLPLYCSEIIFLFLKIFFIAIYIKNDEPKRILKLLNNDNIVFRCWLKNFKLMSQRIYKVTFFRAF